MDTWDLGNVPAGASGWAADWSQRMAEEKSNRTSGLIGFFVFLSAGWELCRLPWSDSRSWPGLMRLVRFNERSHRLTPPANKTFIQGFPYGRRRAQLARSQSQNYHISPNCTSLEIHTREYFKENTRQGRFFSLSLLQARWLLLKAGQKRDTRSESAGENVLCWVEAAITIRIRNKCDWWLRTASRGGRRQEPPGLWTRRWDASPAASYLDGENVSLAFQGNAGCEVPKV